MAEKYVLIGDLADELKREPSNLARSIRKYGIKAISVRHPESGRRALAITKAEAECIMAAALPSVEIIKAEKLRRRR
jgi:hypothetical protein